MNCGAGLGALKVGAVFGSDLEPIKMVLTEVRAALVNLVASAGGCGCWA